RRGRFARGFAAVELRRRCGGSLARAGQQYPPRPGDRRPRALSGDTRAFIALAPEAASAPRSCAAPRWRFHFFSLFKIRAIRPIPRTPSADGLGAAPARPTRLAHGGARPRSKFQENLPAMTVTAETRHQNPAFEADEARHESRASEADVAKLLTLIVHSVYADKEVFVRELISNAADACEKLRYEAIASPDLLGDDPTLRISIVIDADNKRLTVEDNGI